MVTAWQGYLALAVSVLSWGSAFVPVRRVIGSTPLDPVVFQVCLTVLPDDATALTESFTVLCGDHGRVHRRYPIEFHPVQVHALGNSDCLSLHRQ